MTFVNIENHILHIDDHLIVLNKPAGLRVIPDGYDPSLPNVRDMLNALYSKTWVVHRLDKDTSGVLLFARDAATHRELSLQFENRSIQKQYHLIVKGIPDWNTRTVNLPLCVNGDRKHRTVVDFSKGKSAETEFSVKERFSHHTLLTAAPHSGYTHQIRAHISAAGFPILGDSLYWKAGAHLSKSNTPSPRPSSSPLIGHVALHAAQITIFDIYTKEHISFTAPPPSELLNCMDKIRIL